MPFFKKLRHNVNSSISVDCFRERRSLMENINLSLIMLFLILYIIKSGSHLNR